MQPNLDDGCSTSKVWLDHLRIRAAALRNAYADLNAAAPVASRLTLQIGAPTLSQPKYAGTLGQVGCPRYFCMQHLFCRFRRGGGGGCSCRLRLRHRSLTAHSCHQIFAGVSPEHSCPVSLRQQRQLEELRSVYLPRRRRAGVCSSTACRMHIWQLRHAACFCIV